jgi:putative aldouronate transport system substrate-binding protein
MKKLIKVFLLLTALVAVMALSACRSDDETPATTPTPPTPTPVAADPTPTPAPEVVELGDPRLAQHGLEIVDGTPRFIETQNISALMWNRNHDRWPDITTSYWADWMRAELLRIHNIAVDFTAVPRWGPEYNYLAALLAAGEAPDVAFTFSYPTVETFADMAGVLNLWPLVDAYLDFFPHFYEISGMDNLLWNQDPFTNEIWAFAGRHHDHLLRINTFVREDWLAELSIAPPTSLQEFEDMLVAFRDNADLLLGADANQMIPFRLTDDVAWTGDHVIASFIPDAITDREWFVYGFDERRFTMPGIKEGVRVLNRWFNMGLLWEDFSLHTAADERGDDLIRLGFVGSFSGNWDIPFRAADRLIVDMQENVGPQANFMVVTPFPNDAGRIRFQVPHGTDRSIFFPHTNRNPVASLLYLDWISRPDVIEFLMFGHEGVHHARTPEGAFQTLPFDYVPDNQFIPSLRNFDLLLTFNGLPLDSAIAAATLALGFPGIDPAQVMEAHATALRYAWVGPRAIVGPITAEAGMGPSLNAMRDATLNQAVVAPEDQFDAVFDSGMANYMAAGGAAIIAERREAWIRTYGDVDWLPQQ